MTQPSKEKTRKWIAKRVREHKPLPDMKQIKREIGWDLAEAARKNKH